MCPCCGAKGVQAMTILEGLQAQVYKVASLVAFLGAAILGQSDLVGEPTKHYVTVVSILCSALVAWNLKQHPVKDVA
jgi:hypothetical protein